MSRGRVGGVSIVRAKMTERRLKQTHHEKHEANCEPADGLSSCPSEQCEYEEG